MTLYFGPQNHLKDGLFPINTEVKPVPGRRFVEYLEEFVLSKLRQVPHHYSFGDPGPTDTTPTVVPSFPPNSPSRLQKEDPLCGILRMVRRFHLFDQRDCGGSTRQAKKARKPRRKKKAQGPEGRKGGAAIGVGMLDRGTKNDLQEWGMAPG